MSKSSKELFEKLGFEVHTQEIQNGDIVRLHLLMTPFRFYTGDMIVAFITELKQGWIITDFGALEKVFEKTRLLDDKKNEEALRLILKKFDAFRKSHPESSKMEIGIFAQSDLKKAFEHFAELMSALSNWVFLASAVMASKENTENLGNFTGNLGHG